MRNCKYLQRLTLIILFSLPASASQADTFELSDPAAEIMNEQSNPKEPAPLPDFDMDTVAEWTSDGMGSTTCSQHLINRQESGQEYGLNLQWLQGFIEGVAYQRFVTLGDNRLRPDTNLEETALWIENYCIENPFDDLQGAARAYLRKLSQ